MTDSSPAPSEDYIAKLNTNVPHGARTWNYWLGGTDNFPIDREIGERVREVYPEIVEVARAARAFLVRVVTYLAGEAGIRQFLDIGSGLPTANNTHEVSQRVAPQSRVVYVDNDPLVLVHAHALLASGPQGATDYIDADMHDVDKILREAARTLDLTRVLNVLRNYHRIAWLTQRQGRQAHRRMLDKAAEIMRTGTNPDAVSVHEVMALIAKRRGQ
jgi:hypothetical protein